MTAKRKMLNFANIVVVTSLLFGATLFIYTPSFAIGTLIIVGISPFFFIPFITDKLLSLEDICLFFWLSVLFIFSVASCFVYIEIANFQYLKAFGLNLLTFPVLYYIVKQKANTAGTAVIFYLVVILIIGFLQQSYIFFGHGIDPKNDATLNYVSDNVIQLLGIRSIFDNSNDFAAICVLILFLVCYGFNFSNVIRTTAISAISITLLLTASRLSFAAGLLILIPYYLSSKRRLIGVIYFILLLSISISTVMYIIDVSIFETFWGSKLLSFSLLFGITEVNGTLQTADESAISRISNYTVVMQNIHNLGSGSFRAQNYSDIVKEGGLFSENPHSLFFELALLYGYYGIFSYVGIFYWLMTSIRSMKSSLIVNFMLTSSLVLLTFASSSSINFPAFWVLLFLIGLTAKYGHAS